jgi:hypothetical protein
MGTFQALDDDLSCLILERLVKPIDKLGGNPHYVTKGMGYLASAACVSRRYARLVRQRVWEAACRRIAPEVCAQITESSEMTLPGETGIGPGRASWLSFAKLLTWCPAQLRINPKYASLDEDGRGAVCRGIGMDGRGIHVCEPDWSVAAHLCKDPADLEAVPSEEVLADASICGALFGCKHSFVHRGMYYPSVMQERIERKVYRGFISSIGNLAAVAGNNGGSKSEGERGLCPFCASPLQKFPLKSLSLPKGTPADFRLCGAGHLVGLIEQVVQEEEYSDSDSDWDSDIVIDLTEPWMPPP